jgi:hypothetical protein
VQRRRVDTTRFRTAYFRNGTLGASRLEDARRSVGRENARPQGEPGVLLRIDEGLAEAALELLPELGVDLVVLPEAVARVVRLVVLEPAVDQGVV